MREHALKGQHLDNIWQQSIRDRNHMGCVKMVSYLDNRQFKSTLQYFTTIHHESIRSVGGDFVPPRTNKARDDVRGWKGVVISHMAAWKAAPDNELRNFKSKGRENLKT